MPTPARLNRDEMARPVFTSFDDTSANRPLCRVTFVDTEGIRFVRDLNGRVTIERRRWLHRRG
jgi:hypothetical protein